MKPKNKHAAAACPGKPCYDGVSETAAKTTAPTSCRYRASFASMAAAFSVLTALALTATAKATNNFPWGWCTWGAIELWDKHAPAPGCDWGGNAGTWLGNAQAKNWVIRTEQRAVEKNAIIVWTNSGMGHVGVVDTVFSDGSGIRVKEMNWGKQVPGAETGWTYNAGKYTTRDLRFSDKLSTSSFKFAGYIMPRRITAYTADSVLNNQSITDMQALRYTNGNFGSIVSNTLAVNRNWTADYELRSSRFKYWWTNITVYHATWKWDPKVRFTLYYEPFTKNWIGWTQVR
jgi:surface antigen